MSTRTRTTRKPANSKPAEKQHAEPKPAAKKTAAKKPATRKSAAKKPAAQKPAAQKPAAQKPAAQKPATQKPAAQKPATRKSAAKKPAAKKSAAQKPAAQQPSIKKTAAKKPATPGPRRAAKRPAKRPAKPATKPPRRPGTPPEPERGGYDYRFKLADQSTHGELGGNLESPLGPSFELVNGGLVATLRTPNDIRGVQHLVDVLNGMEPDPARRGARPFVPPPPGLPFLREKLDLTAFLPAVLREFLGAHADFLRYVREFSALDRPPDADDSAARNRWERRFDTYVSMREDPSHAHDPGPALLARIQDGTLYSSPRASALRRAWNANCHQFSALLARRAYPGDPSETLSDYRQLRTTRPLTAAEARVGDIAMFIAHGLDDPEVKAKGGLIHSALVIRVSAHLPEFIEVLEKQDPAVALATRTIAEIRDHYAAKHRGTAVTTEIRFYRCPPARQA